jgi:hypothetical protein
MSNYPFLKRYRIFSLLTLTSDQMKELATLLTVTRETHQQILQYAFSDARAQDHSLNTNFEILRHTLLMGFTSLDRAPESILMVWLPISTTRHLHDY